MISLRKGIFRFFYDEVGEVTFELLKINLGIILLLLGIHSVYIATKYHEYRFLYSYVGFLILILLLILSSFIVMTLRELKEKKKMNNRDQYFVDSLNKEASKIGYKVELNISKDRRSYNEIYIYNGNSLINTITLYDFLDIYNASFKELLDFPKSNKEYPKYPKCNTYDELEEYTLTANILRKYIESFTDDERVGFFNSLSYYTGKWCRKWFNSDPEQDVEIDIRKPNTLKLIAQYIPKEQLEQVCHIKQKKGENT